MRVLDICSGIGSGAFGIQSLSKEDISIPIAIEKQTSERLSYQSNHKVEEFPYLVEDFFPSKKDVDLISVIVATPPCQDFTTMNIKRDSTSKRSLLIYEVLRIIESIRPDHFLIENVRGIKTAKDPQGRLYVDYLAKSLKKLGYKLIFDNRPSKQKYIFNAGDFGVPQKRIRYILVGSRLFTPKIPNNLKKINFGDILNKINSSGDVKHSSEMIAKFKNITIKGKWTKLDPSKKYNTAYRLPENGRGLAPTILNQDKTWIIWKDRVLSIAEIKALQTIPQEYFLAGTKKDKQRGLGNVFPARMSYEFLKQFVKNPSPFPSSVNYTNSNSLEKFLVN